MENVEAIEAGADGVSTWRTKAPAGQTVAVKTEIASKKQDEVIAWRSVEDRDRDQRRGSLRGCTGRAWNQGQLVMAYDRPQARSADGGEAVLREPQVQARMI